MTTSQSTHRGPGTLLAACAIAATLIIGGLSSAVHAEAITDDNVAAAVAAAKTPADHQALAEYFTAKAQAAQTNIARHADMAKTFSGRSQLVMADHCQNLMRGDKQLVKDYTALAKEQAALAK